MKASSAVIEIQYLPPVAYFMMLARHERVMIEQHEHYQKNSYRNRCHIAGANGLLRLSIPLKKGKHEQQPIRQTAISFADNWPKQHWASIRSAYSRAPFFDHYAPVLQPHFEQPQPLLFDFCYALLKELIPLLGISAQLSLTTAYTPALPPPISDYREAIRPKQNALKWPLPEYPQVFLERHGFLPNLSVLDLLFCTGPQAGLLLESGE